MTDAIELSSDSGGEDTIIVPTEHFYHEFDDEPGENDIESLVSKYISENCHEASPETKNYKYDEEAFMSDDLDSLLRPKRLKKSSESSADLEVNALQMLSEKYRRTEETEEYKQTQASNKETKKKEKELQKQQKLEERKRKKEEAEREKALFKAIKEVNKNNQKSECMKFVIVDIDDSITKEDYNIELTSTLQAACVRYEIQSQVFAQTITWRRKTQAHLVNDDGQLVSAPKEENADEILFIMNCREFLEHVINGTLCAHIQTLKSVLINKKVILVIYGLESYNRYQKNQKNNERRANITGEEEKNSTNKSFFRDFPTVTKQKIEYTLTELQLLCSCSYRLADSGADLGSLVLQFSKAVAEIPYKLEKFEKFQQTDWFAGGDNRDCVKVDKDGNGLSRLWNQMLTTFSLASLETAEAISMKYPTVSSLMNAYESCTSEKEARSLLQDIPIRRAAGPLSSTRKIGPEMSRKVYTFFTSIDGDALI